MSYAITGASGQLGRLAAALLLDRVDPSQVALFTRGPASLDGFAARGAIVRFCDFNDAFTARLRQTGIPAASAGLLASVGAAARGGYLADVTPAVRDLTDTEPTRLRELPS